MSSGSSIWQDLLSMRERASRAFGRAERHLKGLLNIREDKYGFLWIEVEKFHETFCHDLDDRTESLVWALTQKPTAARCFEEKSGAPAWKVKLCWYQISANDRWIPPETEEWMAERINARKTITLQTSHASIATQPDEIVQIIEEASNAVGAKAASLPHGHRM
jgi:pimeloyl-ACP methyl ester carboxylesterase